MTESDLQALVAAMEYPLLLDRGGGVYWDFDFTVKYDEDERLDDQLYGLVEKAKDYYND